MTTAPPDDGWEGTQPKRPQRRGKPAKPTQEVCPMKPEVRKVRAAAVAANLAAQAAVAARELLEEDPSAWEVGDAAYWLCRAAQKACENAADALDPEVAETSADVFAAHLMRSSSASSFLS